MKTFRFTLLAEGTSDRVLLPIIRWMLIRHHQNFEWIGTIANLQDLPTPPRTLSQKITTTCDLFPADVLFIHRDSDRESSDKRREEIAEAFGHLEGETQANWVPVIPVRMTEAWLLVSEHALRSAAGNPEGRHGLSVPPLARLEAIPDPKQILKGLLLDASGLTGRRRKNSFPGSAGKDSRFFR